MGAAYGIPDGRFEAYTGHSNHVNKGYPTGRFRRRKDLLPTLLCFPVSNQFQGVFGHQSTYGSGAVSG